MRYFRILILLNLVILAAAVKVKVLQPRKNGTLDVGIIITPGADIRGEAYEPLGLKIQESFPGRMWIALLCDFLFNAPNPIELPRAVDDAIDQFKTAGFQGNYIFLAGHSLGGVFVGMYGMNNSPKLTGVMLFASYLTRPHKLKDYPTPLLTLSGDLDGLTRITRIVDTFEELQNDAQNESGGISIIYTKPVIVMQGLNHGHFASGTMPPNVRDHDLPVDKNVTYDYAHETIASFVTCFIIVTIKKPELNYLSAIGCLKEPGFYQTMNLVEPLSTIKAMDTNSKQSSRTTEIVQGYLLGTDLSKHVQVNDTEVSGWSIEGSEPDVEVSGDSAHVQTYSHVVTPFNPEDVSLSPQTPKEIQTAMKSKYGMLHMLPNLSPSGRNLTCKDANQLIYTIAFNTSSNLARKRFLDRKSPKIAFNDDVVSSSIADWSSTDLNLNYGDNGELEVTSVAYVVNPDDTGNKIAGTHHCKLLSPYRALEWFYIDALKRSSSGEHKI